MAGGVIDGQPVSQAITNPAFIFKNADDTMPNKLGFTRPSGSGPTVADIQLAVNNLYTATGVSETQTGTNYNATSGTISNGQNYETALTILADKFDAATGHRHTGLPGDAPPISGGLITDVPLQQIVEQGTMISASGSSTDVSFPLSGKTPSSFSTSSGVIVNNPQNRVSILSVNYDEVCDASGNLVYGRLTYSTGVWTLSYYSLVAGVETSYSFATSTNIQWFYKELFQPLVSTPVYQPLGGFEISYKSVHSLAVSGDTALYGDVTLSGDPNITFARSGQNIKASLPSIAASYAWFSGPTGAATGDAGFIWDNTNKRLGIGQAGATPSAALDVHVSNSNNAIQANNTGTQGSSAGATIAAISDPGAAINSGSRIGQFTMGGVFDGTHTLVNGSAIQAFATENWSSSARGTKMNFYTTKNTTTGLQLVATMDQDKSLSLFGNILLNGSSSGVITQQTQAAAGTYNWNYPTTAGASGQFLASAGGGSNAMYWASPGTTSPATQQILTSGTGATYTVPTPAPKQLVIQAVGAGGGGAGVGTSTAPSGSTGGTTTFNSINAAGGSGGAGDTTVNGQLGGNGGTGGTGTANYRIPGQAGAPGPASVNGAGGASTAAGGAGGASYLGFGGATPSQSIAGNAGQNYGGGGSGAGCTAGSNASGGGGGGGEYFKLLINNPTAGGTYTYTIGTGGAGGIGTGTNAFTGGPGKDGVIIVDEIY